MTKKTCPCRGSRSNFRARMENGSRNRCTLVKTMLVVGMQWSAVKSKSCEQCHDSFGTPLWVGVGLRDLRRGSHGSTKKFAS